MREREREKTKDLSECCDASALHVRVCECAGAKEGSVAPSLFRFPSATIASKHKISHGILVFSVERKGRKGVECRRKGSKRECVVNHSTVLLFLGVAIFLCSVHLPSFDANLLIEGKGAR